MPQKPMDGQLRKRPSHSVGKGIVDAIVEATSRIIEADGIEALTTNRIAQVAGVSIGSFYQYFPNREAVVAEIGRRTEQKTLAFARERMEEAAGDPIATADCLVDLLASSTLGGIKTRAAVREGVPEQWMLRESAEVDRVVEALICDALRAHRALFAPVGDPEVAAMMLRQSTEATVERCIAAHPGWLESGALGAHIKLMVRRFLGLPDADLLQGISAIERAQ